VSYFPDFIDRGTILVRAWMVNSSLFCRFN